MGGGSDIVAVHFLVSFGASMVPYNSLCKMYDYTQWDGNCGFCRRLQQIRGLEDVQPGAEDAVGHRRLE